MAAITRSAGSYAIMASASLKPNAEALRKLGEASGKAVPTTQTTLTGQSNDLSRFIQKVSAEAEPLAALETARGLSRSADISLMVSDALKATQQRFASAQARNSGRPAGSAAGGSGAALVAMLKSALSSQDDLGFDFSALIARPGASKVKPSQINVSAAKQDQPDVYERGIPLTTAAGGSGTLSITRAAIGIETIEMPLDKANPGVGVLPGVRYTPQGSATADNEGFYVKASTGSGDDTVVLDTRDPTEEDTRLTAIELSTGEGSDVVFIAGNNVSSVDAGAGDDLVAAEGDATVHGGEGDDLIFARTAFGDAGDDVIFSDGFASGGDGDDSITLFSLDPDTDEVAKLAFGGAGNDEIVASVKADVDGGDGDDVIILRDGGTAGGGAGNDRISAWSNATIEGGEGNDDIMLFTGGAADGGAGDDRIEANYYATASGGKGADTVILNGGGTYTFAKGDGADAVTLSKPRAQLDDANKAPVNRIVIDGYAAGDLTLDVQVARLIVTPTGLNTDRDKLTVDREIMGKVEVVFRKNGQQQTLVIDGLTQTMGPLGPATA